MHNTDMYQPLLSAASAGEGKLHNSFHAVTHVIYGTPNATKLLAVKLVTSHLKSAIT